MSEFEVLIPKLGESIQEATVTKVFVKVGDNVSEDDPLFEVATDKVDSEIPSPVSGVIKAILCKADDILAVGKVAIIIDLDGEVEDVTAITSTEVLVEPLNEAASSKENPETLPPRSVSNRFY